jgi:hypothetical protein
VFPGRIADKVLELLGAAFVNHGRHRGEGAVVRLRQPAQIACRHRRAVAGLAAEEAAVVVAEDGKRLGHPIDQGFGQPSSGHTVT